MSILTKFSKIIFKKTLLKLKQKILNSFEKEYGVKYAGSEKEAGKIQKKYPGAVIVGWGNWEGSYRIKIEIPIQNAIKRNKKRKETIKKIDEMIQQY